MPVSSADPKKENRFTLGRSPWLLALAVLLLVGVGALLGWLLLNRASGYTEIEGNGIRMSVPDDWDLEDTAANQACQTQGLECVAILSTPQGYNFSVTWYEQTAEISVEAVDEREWKKFVEYYPSAILFNRKDVQVGGLPAIQRTFLQNDAQNTPVYFRQVYVVNGLRLYLITARFFSAEMMDAHAGVVDAVIESIQFTDGE
jgi:hypothetical protein